MFIILIPAYVYLNMYTYLPPVCVVICSLYIPMFLYFLLFPKLNRHVCHGVYWCLNINNRMSKSTITFITIQHKSVLVHVCFVLCIFCLYICVCECLVQNNNVYSKTTIIKQLIKMIQIAGVPSSQAALAYLITAHHLCAFLLYLAH